MFVPWKPLDAVKQGRSRWKRGQSWRRKAGLFTNQTYWVVEPAQAPFITGYGVLIAKVYHKYSGVTPGLKSIYGGFTHDLIRILAKYNIKDDKTGKLIANNSFIRGYYAYRISSDLFNKVIGRSNRAIVSASARLAESNLSYTERKRINNMIRRSNSMLCLYDFKRDYLYKP